MVSKWTADAGGEMGKLIFAAERPLWWEGWIIHSITHLVVKINIQSHLHSGVVRIKTSSFVQLLLHYLELQRVMF